MTPAGSQNIEIGAPSWIPDPGRVAEHHLYAEQMRCSWTIHQTPRHVVACLPHTLRAPSPFSSRKRTSDLNPST
jgi:hypothetical protein